MRVGHGTDVHRFDVERRLVLGGVNIPYKMGLQGHSDADVLIHAIIDALLGAVGERDIGKHFPDSSEEFLNISSLKLLHRTGDILKKRGYRVGNIDSTLVAQEPKLAPYIPEMIIKLASELDIDTSFINVKATTTEGLGFVGRQEGIAAHAVAIIEACEKPDEFF